MTGRATAAVVPLWLLCLVHRGAGVGAGKAPGLWGGCGLVEVLGWGRASCGEGSSGTGLEGHFV